MPRTLRLHRPRPRYKDVPRDVPYSVFHGTLSSKKSQTAHGTAAWRSKTSLVEDVPVEALTDHSGFNGTFRIHVNSGFTEHSGSTERSEFRECSGFRIPRHLPKTFRHQPANSRSFPQCHVRPYRRKHDGRHHTPRTEFQSAISPQQN